MRIEVKTINPTPEQREISVQPYAVDLHLTDRMVRLGTFTAGVFDTVPTQTEESEARFHTANLYRENVTTVFKSAEDAAHAIAEYQMGAHIADLVPVHLAFGIPD